MHALSARACAIIAAALTVVLAAAAPARADPWQDAMRGAVAALEAGRAAEAHELLDVAVREATVVAPNDVRHARASRRRSTHATAVSAPTRHGFCSAAS
jgi:hypothetical protein